MLVDIENFAINTNNKILGLSASSEKTVEVNYQPTENKNSSVKSTKKKSSKRKKRGNKKEQDPFILQEIPIEIKVLGYYPNIIKFIQKLENYQRKIVIEAVEAKDYNKEANETTPRVEMKINAKIFTFKKNAEFKQEEKNDTGK